MKKLTLIDKASLLKRTPLFSSLDLDLLLPIADKMGLVTYEPGEVVFFVDEESTRMYFIAYGKIEIKNKEGKTLTTLKTNDFFGDESLFSDKPRGYEAIATDKTQLLTLSRNHLFTIISECPSVALGFLQVYTTNMHFRYPEENR
jgi:CRP/FNR family transcriptional regulator, cyclic AMP receptor protein